VPTSTLTPFAALRSRLQAALNAAYPELIPRVSWSRDQLLAHQRDGLEELLRHATAPTPLASTRPTYARCR